MTTWAQDTVDPTLARMLVIEEQREAGQPCGEKWKRETLEDILEGI